MPVRSVTIRLLGDYAGAQAAFSWVNDEADKLDGRNPTVKIGANITGAVASIAELRAFLDELDAHAGDIRILADETDAQIKILQITAEIEKLNEALARPTISVDGILRAQARLLALSKQLDALDTEVAVAHVELEDGDTEAKLALIYTQLRALSHAAENIEVNPGDAGAFAQFVLGLQDVEERLRDADEAGRITEEDLDALKDLVLGAAIGFRDFASAIGEADTTASGVFGTLDAVMRKFTMAGQFLSGSVPLKTWIHLAVDGIAELAAILGPATLALVTFGGAAAAAAEPTLANLFYWLKGTETASFALGQNIAPLSGQFTKVGNAVQPSVMEAYGDALAIVNKNTGEFGDIAERAWGWIDGELAKITVDLDNNGGALQKLLDIGVRDLGILANIFSTLGSDLARLFDIAEITHIAEDLLLVIDGFAHLLGWVLKLPTPLLAVGLALHGVYLWGGALYGLIVKFIEFTGLDTIFTGLMNVGKAFAGLASSGADAAGLTGIAEALGKVAGKSEVAEEKVFNFASGEFEAGQNTGILAKALAFLPDIPVWGWVALGALALGGLVFWLSRSKDATDVWVTSMKQGIASATDAGVFDLMASDVGKLNTALSANNTQFEKMRATGDVIGPQMDQNAHDQGVLAAALQSTLGDMKNYSQGTAYIMTQYGVSYPQALAIAQEANVHLAASITGNSKAAQIARQEISGLMQGYQEMHAASGIAAADIEVQQYATSDFAKAVQSVNSDWDQWVKNVTGSQGGFDTFAQGMNTLNSDSTTFEYHLGVLTLKGTQGKAAIDGLSASSLNLNQAFSDQVNNLESLLDSMRSANATQGEFTTTVKGGVAALLPFATGSKEATSQLYDMAQQADYTGADSIADLSKWAGVSAPNALGTMKSAADKATVAASNLASTISNILDSQFDQDIVKASGASAALSKYTTDLVNNQQNTARGSDDRKALIKDLVNAGLSAKQADSYVKGLGTSLDKLPKKETPDVIMTGTGHYTISGLSTQAITGNNPTLLRGARGMYVRGGTPGKDSVPILAMEGEAVVPRHLVGAIAPLMSAHGVPGFTAGGMVGTDWPGTTFGTFQTTMTKAMETAISNAALLSSAAGAGSGVTRWSTVILESLSLLHQPLTLLADVEHRMSQESGGNATVVNKWDSNWAAGTPSVGLMQVIGPTFAAYAGPFRGTGPFEYGVSVNPLANVYAGLSYALHNYGSIASAMMKAGGYDAGGLLMPGLNLAYNGTGVPEVVTPPGAGKNGAGSNVNVNVYCHPSNNPAETARAIHQMLRAYKQTKGNQPLGLG
jgi:SLT domain-containing protein